MPRALALDTTSAHSLPPFPHPELRTAAMTPTFAKRTNQAAGRTAMTSQQSVTRHGKDDNGGPKRVASSANKRQTPVPSYQTLLDDRVTRRVGHRECAALIRRLDKDDKSTSHPGLHQQQHAPRDKTVVTDPDLGQGQGHFQSQASEKESAELDPLFYQGQDEGKTSNKHSSDISVTNKQDQSRLSRKQSLVKDQAATEVQRSRIVSDPWLLEGRRSRTQSLLNDSGLAQDQRLREHNMITNNGTTDDQKSQEQYLLADPDMAESQRLQEQSLLADLDTAVGQKLQEQSLLTNPDRTEGQRLQEQRLLIGPEMSEGQRLQEQSLLTGPDMLDCQRLQEQSLLTDPDLPEGQRLQEQRQPTDHGRAECQRSQKQSLLSYHSVGEGRISQKQSLPSYHGVVEGRRSQKQSLTSYHGIGEGRRSQKQSLTSYHGIGEGRRSQKQSLASYHGIGEGRRSQKQSLASYHGIGEGRRSQKQSLLSYHGLIPGRERRHGVGAARRASSAESCRLLPVESKCSRLTHSHAKSHMYRIKWQTAARRIRLIYRICTILSGLSLSLESHVKTFADIGDDMLDQTKSAKHVQREPLLSHKVEKILSSQPGERTKEQLTVVVCDLRAIPGFCSFSVDVQMTLARHGTLLRIGMKRVIIRQGHRSENWYYIISGQALVTEIVKEGEMTKRVTHACLRRGMSFGEMGLLKNAPRLCTVTSRGPMKLLVVTGDVYLDTFVKNAGDSGAVPDHIAFIKELEFMRHWPWENLLKHPTQCTQRYCLDRQVLVADSCRSKYIYIIKSGTCTVYQHVGRTRASWRDLELHLVNPCVGWDGRPEPKVDTGVGKVRPSFAPYALYNRLSSPNLVERDIAHRTDLLTGPPYVDRARLHHTCQPCVLSRAPRRAAAACKETRGQFASFSFSREVRKSRLGESGLASVCMADKRPSADPCLESDASDFSDWETDSPTSANSRSSHSHTHTDLVPAILLTKPDDETPDRPSSTFHSLSAVEELRRSADSDVSGLSEEEPETSPNCQPQQHRKRKGKGARRQYSVPPECQPCRPRPRPHSDPYSVSHEPCLVTIHTLQAGDVFGLDHLKEHGYENRPRSHKVVMVSNGAEVVTLSKRFFRSYMSRHAAADVQRCMRVYLSPGSTRARLRLHLAGLLWQRKMADELEQDLVRSGRKQLGLHFRPPSPLDPRCAKDDDS